jgi:transaldolase
MLEGSGKTLLAQMGEGFPTVLWNDSCSLAELADTIERNGTVGATCNPVIVLELLRKEWLLWKDRVAQLARDFPRSSETDLAWRVTEAMSRQAAELLRPAFERSRGRNGRLSIQVDPKSFRDPDAMLEQAVRFARLAPNIIVKIPATRAGISAMEEATYRGISVNATVCFTLPQALAVADAVERGLSRREREKLDSAGMGPVCTIMVGRLDDWLKCVVDHEGIIVTPGILEWAGVAVMKKAYRLYSERGCRLRLLVAAFRNHLHWSEFVGGDVVISPPYAWQQRFNRCDVAVADRMGVPVEPGIIQELERKLPDFRRAYQEDGLSPEEFDHYGATRRTLRQFCKGVDDLGALIRDVLIPNPEA